MHTPRYVHYLLDHLFRGEPLNFHGASVPPDVRRRILLEHRRQTAPGPIAANAGLVPRQPQPAARASAAMPAEVTGRPTPVIAGSVVTLTDREIQTLNGMAAGMSNLAIGQEHHISEDTVKTHARRLFRKLGARDRAHAVALAFRHGLIK